MSGAELALRLLSAFRGLVDDVHAELARDGHDDVRPAHGFALQALGPRGATAAELGTRLGVSKQAAGKTVDGLVDRGWAERVADPMDARRKIVVVTATGRELLRCSADAFDRLRDEREARVGTEAMRRLESALRAITPSARVPLDAASWFDGSEQGAL